MAENNNRVELIKEQLLSVADKPPRTEVILSQEDITFLCQSALEIFKKEKPLRRVEAPITICGDTHGQYSDLLRILEIGGMPPKTQYFFFFSQFYRFLFLLIAFWIFWMQWT